GRHRRHAPYTRRMAQESATVVVGVDGSPCSIEAVRWAADEARTHKGRLRAVHAWHYTATASHGGIPPAVSLDVDELKDAAEHVSRLRSSRRASTEPMSRSRSAWFKGRPRRRSSMQRRERGCWSSALAASAASSASSSATSATSARSSRRARSRSCRPPGGTARAQTPVEVVAGRDARGLAFTLRYVPETR